jgi:hypothetical protein
MLRVARLAVVISDSNNVGQGRPGVRALKRLLKGAGLWRAVDLVRTRGRGYRFSEGDGVYYSFSAFDDFDLLRRACSAVHVMNTEGATWDHYGTAGHVLLIGAKTRSAPSGGSAQSSAKVR